MTTPKRYVSLTVHNAHWGPIEGMGFMYHGMEEYIKVIIPPGEEKEVNIPLFPFYGPADCLELKESIQLLIHYHGNTLQKFCHVNFPDGAKKIRISWKQGVASVDAQVLV